MTTSGQLSIWVPSPYTDTVPDLRTSSLSSATSLPPAGAGASIRRAVPLSPGDSSASAPNAAPDPRTTNTLRSGTSIGPAGFSSVRQHDGRSARIGGRRDPGVNARLRALGERTEAEGRAQAVGGTVAHRDHEHENAEQQQRA